MKQLLAAVVTIFLFIGCAQEKPKSDATPHMEKETTHMMDSTIVRDKSVDVASLDANKDGKVFQCPMHYEVIAEKNVPCPLCKMDLEEVTVADAGGNLK